MIVVSGLPRAGTSLMMQMISAIGVPAFSDGHRPADASNPRGYLEHAAVRRLDRDARCLDGARGHVVKIVSPLLPALPAPRSPFVYRVVFVRRDLEEVLRSQALMLGAVGHDASNASDAKLSAAMEKAEARARRFVAARPDVDWIEVSHADLMAQPLATARRVTAFILGALDVAAAGAMAACVDPELHRVRGSSALP
jgi:hypothetical protein